MKKEGDWFEGRDPQLIYIAKRLRDATRLEEILTVAGIDYGVERMSIREESSFGARAWGRFFMCCRRTGSGRRARWG